MDTPTPPLKKKENLGLDSQIALERRIQGSLREMDLRQERLKKSQPFSIIPLVLILGVIFVGLVVFTLLRSVGAMLDGNHSKTTTNTLIPRLKALPEFTKNNFLTIQGKTSPNTNVQLVINGDDSSIISSDQYGDFYFRNVTLTEGKNRIKVKLANAANFIPNEGESKEFIINYDATPPTLNLNNLPATTEESSIAIVGTTDGYELFVDGTFTYITAEGRFETSVNLNEGENKINVKALDQAGNEILKTIMITYKPKSSPTEAPTKTRTPTITITPISTNSPTETAITNTPTPNPTNTPPAYYILTPRN